MTKPDFVRIARDMADDVTKRPGDGIAALAIMSLALREAYAAGLERAAEIADKGLAVPSEYSCGMMVVWAEAECEIATAIRAEMEKTND